MPGPGDADEPAPGAQGARALARVPSPLPPCHRPPVTCCHGPCAPWARTWLCGSGSPARGAVIPEVLRTKRIRFSSCFCAAQRASFPAPAARRADGLHPEGRHPGVTGTRGLGAPGWDPRVLRVGGRLLSRPPGRWGRETQAELQGRPGPTSEGRPGPTPK